MGETNGKLPKPGVDVPLLVVGCDFRRASAAYRSLLVSNAETRLALYEALSRVDPGAGFMTLETCNRIEWLVSTEQPQWLGELLQAQIMKKWTSHSPVLEDLPQVYMLPGKEAAQHVFRLVAGMESLAAGEAEIAGQFQRALQRAMTENTTSRILNGIGRFTGGMAKTSHRLGYRSAHARGIHVLVARHLKERFGDTAHQRKVVIAGMGEIGRKTADFIQELLGATVVRVNRTVSKKHAKSWVPLEQLEQLLGDADALVVATGAQKPLVTPDTLTHVPPKRVLEIVDIGIPQQVAHDVARLDGVSYFDVDGLTAPQRDPELDAVVAKLEIEVEDQVERFSRYCRERHMVRLLRRAQNKRLELTQSTIGRFVEEQLGGALDEQEKTRVASAMRQMIREYSNDVFESLHSALEEFWSSE
jgi:glutamyl-tRNA reductase